MKLSTKTKNFDLELTVTESKSAWLSLTKNGSTAKPYGYLTEKELTDIKNNINRVLRTMRKLKIVENDKKLKEEQTPGTKRKFIITTKENFALTDKQRQDRIEHDIPLYKFVGWYSSFGGHNSGFDTLTEAKQGIDEIIKANTKERLKETMKGDTFYIVKADFYHNGYMLRIHDEIFHARKLK